MKYISQPPLLLNVHMHNPTVHVRSWMDSLLAFFPGLQVQNFFIIFNQIENGKFAAFSNLEQYILINKNTAILYIDIVPKYKKYSFVVIWALKYCMLHFHPY